MIILDIHDNKILNWSLDDVLKEINRDHDEDWIPYDETDWREGWDEFVEGDLYRLISGHNERHGGAYDRGSADAWYGRPCQPHYYVGDSYFSDRVEKADMNEAEIAAYMKGYGDGPQDHKEY